MACGQLLKIPFDDIAAALKRAKSARGRQCFHRVRGITLIDDTYNANPVSYQNAIRTLALSRGRGKVMLVAADMLELGDKSAALHSKIGAAAGRAGIDHILTLGPLAALIGKQAKKANPAVQVKHYARTEDMARDLRSLCVKGDVLLVKGSRGMHMERLVECLLKEVS
jgi:UDP-N-acetylmuramoyl-tripeptide--D-alanyl-D-alanine ligase